MSSSTFLAPDQSGAASTSGVTSTAQDTLFSAGDAAETIGASPTTVKRIASELRLSVQQTKGGLWVFTGAQVAKIQAERERRQQEDWRR